MLEPCMEVFMLPGHGGLGLQNLHSHLGLLPITCLDLNSKFAPPYRMSSVFSSSQDTNCLK